MASAGPCLTVTAFLADGSVVYVSTGYDGFEITCKQYPDFDDWKADMQGGPYTAKKIDIPSWVTRHELKGAYREIRINPDLLPPDTNLVVDACQ